MQENDTLPKNRSIRPSVRVQRTSAQLTIQLLSKMRLVDGDFNLRNEDKTLAVPLIRGLQTMESELLQRELGAILGEDEFEPRKKSPRTLEDALSGKISLEALKDLPRSLDRKSTRLNSSHRCISYAVFCLKKKK